MPILNLTPHTIALYSAADVQEARDSNALIFFRTAAKELRCGLHSSRLPPARLPYSEWDPEPVPALVSEMLGPTRLLDVLEDWPTTAVVREGGISVPVREVEYGPITGLPAPVAGTYLIVSLPIIAAARAEERTTDDLLTVGDLVRDPDGNIAGCTSFFRWPSDGSTARSAWQDRVLEAIRTGQP